MSIALKQPTLTGQCVAEFLGTALMIFSAQDALQRSRSRAPLSAFWEISIIWGIAVSMGSTSAPAFRVPI